MKKLLLTSATALLLMGVQAQEAEVDATIKAFGSENLTEVLSHAKAASQLLKEPTTIDPDKLAEFYHAAGIAAQKSGDMGTAANYFALLSQIEHNPYYYAKNKDTRETEYFFDKSTAEAVTSKGNYNRLKERSVEPKYSDSITQNLVNAANESFKSAKQAFDSKNYKLAADKFLETYLLTKATGKDRGLYKYYSGISFLQTDDKAQAAQILQELIDAKFDGVETMYLAEEKTSGQKVSFNSKQDMDSQVRLGLYKNATVEKTESLEEELYSNATFAYFAIEDWDKGITTAKNGLAKFPKNENMSSLLSSMYFKSGKQEQFQQNLEDKIKDGTANYLDYFNLGKVLEDSGDKERAKELYLQSIQQKDDFDSPYINLATMIIAKEVPLVDLMNENLGTSAKQKKIYNESKAQRRKLYEEALPYLEKAHEIDDQNGMVISLLKISYEVVENDEKYFEFKKKYEQLNK